MNAAFQNYHIADLAKAIAALTLIATLRLLGAVLKNYPHQPALFSHNHIELQSFDGREVVVMYAILDNEFENEVGSNAQLAHMLFIVNH